MMSPETIKTFFSSIAPYYDRTNTLLSFGMHKHWNRTLVDALTSYSPYSLLDLCAGTGAISFSFLKKNPASQAILLDFCPEMLQVAHKRGTLYKTRFTTLEGDASELPFEKKKFDAVSVAYGIRNVKEKKRCFLEVERVLKPGGIFGILELTRPRLSFLQKGHSYYLKTMLPLLGKWGAKDKEAYLYLSDSIHHFLSPQEVEASLLSVGFASVKIKPLFFGTATLFLAQKANSHQ